MTQRWRVCADLVLSALESAELADHTTVVLIGSEARNVRTWRSDVDILVLRDNGARLQIRPTAEMHLQQETRRRFLERLREGDDYPMWALRYGLPLFDPDRWWATQVAREKERPHWPDWTGKIVPASKRIKMANGLLETDDVEAATEELLYAASHIGRAILLARRVFPLSRSEIPDQLRPHDPEVASAMEQLIAGSIDLPGLKQSQHLLQNRLQVLSEKADVPSA